MSAEPAADACGAPVNRCAGCQTTVGSFYDQCPKCHGTDFEPSTCRRRRLADATRCHLHGGRTPQARAKAAEHQVSAEAREALAQLGEAAPVADPLRRLLALAGEVDARLAVFRGMVAELDELSMTDAFNVDRGRAVVGLYVDASRDLASALTAIARLNLDERLVRIEEAQARALQQIVERLLSAVLPAGRLGDATRWLAAAIGALETGREAPPLPDLSPPRSLPVASLAAPASPATVEPADRPEPPEPPARPSEPAAGAEGAQGADSTNDADPEMVAGKHRTTTLRPQDAGFGTWATTAPDPRPE